jgi:hypothetical protein
MNVPGFTAEATLYKTSVSYYVGKTLSSPTPVTELMPAAFGLGGFGYTCDSKTNKCTCTGPQDCFEMGDGHDCKFDAKLKCTGNTCTCDWWGHGGRFAMA